MILESNSITTSIPLPDHLNNNKANKLREANDTRSVNYGPEGQITAQPNYAEGELLEANYGAAKLPA